MSKQTGAPVTDVLRGLRYGFAVVVVMTVSSRLAALLEERTVACRLSAAHALQTLEDAERFVAARGLLTLTPDCALPSLFGACHEEPYQPGGHGFASWPKTRWWWAFALGGRPGIHALKIHRGRTLFLSSQVAALVDPLCSDALRRADQGDYGPTAAELVQYLSAAGPTRIEDIKRELGLDTASLRAARERVERVGAVVSRALAVPTLQGGERETSELVRWDHYFDHYVPAASEREPDSVGGLEDVVVAAVRAAVVAPESEIARWFSWAWPRDLLTQLVESGRLWQPQEGWLAAHEALR